MPTLDSRTLGSPRANARRRTKRMALTVPVEVSGKDVENSSFSVATTAINLNRNGATLHLSRDLHVDSVILIKNSRGARTPAPVASETPCREISLPTAWSFWKLTVHKISGA
jgi:hypothetical protein